jgi:D-lyxose ketol-isomerase
MMKRSLINQTIETAKRVFSAVGMQLPPFAFWTVDDWQTLGKEADEIRLCMLGWDITDFGQGKFDQLGRTLFTLRNGSSRYDSGKDYAEKLILDPEDQKPPLHFHRRKMEDIINRGGGNIMIRLYRANAQGQCSDESFPMQIDGITRQINAGDVLRLKPGQSLCIPPRTIHQFWGERGTGIAVDGKRYTVSGEVSRVCDDFEDNCWLEACERFCRFEEDEPRQHYLVHEYPAAAAPLDTKLRDLTRTER